LRGGRLAAWLLGVLVLSAIVITVPAGRRPFWSSDEARYALLGQDVLERGQWLVAQLRDQPYLNKPQLFFWTVAVVSMPFGRVSEATAAIPPVIASLVGVIGVIAIGHLLWGWWTGVVAGLVLVTTPFHFEMSHQVLPDLMLSAWLVWALYCGPSAAAGGSAPCWRSMRVSRVGSCPRGRRRSPRLPRPAWRSRSATARPRSAGCGLSWVAR
jgi:4-amino-4-deoxy-L-arabinose transferase-like glycosyltransferase